MLHPPTAVLIQYAVRPFLKWFWEEGKDVLDYRLLDPIFMLNRREGSNAGKGDGTFTSTRSAMPKFFAGVETAAKSGRKSQFEECYWSPLNLPVLDERHRGSPFHSQLAP
jgi:hypothetical protein